MRVAFLVKSLKPCSSSPFCSLIISLKLPIIYTALFSLPLIFHKIEEEHYEGWGCHFGTEVSGESFPIREIGQNRTSCKPNMPHTYFNSNIKIQHIHAKSVSITQDIGIYFYIIKIKYLDLLLDTITTRFTLIRGLQSV